MPNKIYFSLLLLIILFSSCQKDDEMMGTPVNMQLQSARVGTVTLQVGTLTENTPLDQPLVVTFSAILDTNEIKDKINLQKENGETLSLEFAYLDNFKTVSAKPDKELLANTIYKLQLSDGIKGQSGESFQGVEFRFQTATPPLLLDSLTIDGQNMLSGNRIKNVSRRFVIEAHFSHEIQLDEFKSRVSVSSPGAVINPQIAYLDGKVNAFRITPQDSSPDLALHTLFINAALQSVEGYKFDGFSKRFYTKLDSTYQFPEISDEALLTAVQQQTFKYFWDFGHEVSGLARERNTSGNTVTSGGSGFGLMALIVGMERGFITRAEGVERLQTIVDFLAQADRFHGVWSHWLNGATGDVIPFSANDNGGDLVETSYLAMGLLTVRQYLDPQSADEQGLINKINTLWESIEWNWHTQGGQNVLYWHWSPNFGWEKNLKIRGWNESLITYIMAAASPTYGIEPAVYHEGWAQNGAMVNGDEFYGITLPLGRSLGGPLFFAHYTFMGIDPRNLSDQYANYWEQNTNHTLINRQYCVTNPRNFVGYGEGIWGLTASDGNQGYSAHSPTNDRGVITPTAALSSFPYTPEESMTALKHFYYFMGDKLWGEYGFYDAFNPTEGWRANSFLAIDQGPIIVMIENHRTGLLWELFMSCPEVQNGLDKLGFSY